MKTWKKFLSVLLCAVMILSLVPSGAVRAEDVSDDAFVTEQDTADADSSDTELPGTERSDEDASSIETETGEPEAAPEDGASEDPMETEPAEEPLIPAPAEEETLPAETRAAKTGTVLAFSSDVHNKEGDASAARLGTWIERITEKYGGIDVMGFCGDLADAQVSESTYWSLAQNVISTVSSANLPACYTTGNHEFNPGNYSTTSNAVKNNYIIGGEGARGSDYVIYCLGSDNWNSKTDNYTAAQADALKSYFEGFGSDKVIIVLTHYPLHLCDGSGVPGWNYGARKTQNADKVIDALNYVVTRGNEDPSDDRTVVLLWGHNHTVMDPYYDEVYAPGNTLTYNTSGNSKTFQFYYGAAGCMSDSEYGTGSAYVKGKGLVITIQNGTPVFDYCNADGVSVSDGVIYPPEPVAVEGVTLDKTEAEVEVGRTIRLTATVTPANADDPTVYFTSSNDAVATVTNGVVKGISEGTAVITATTKDGGFTASCTVTVLPRSSDITGYVITIGGYALSTAASGDELVNYGGNQSQKYLYHGLSGVPYSAGDTPTEDIVWLLTETGTANTYYIQSIDGRYLNATYLSNSTGGKTGELFLAETEDTWTCSGSLDDWVLNGCTLKSTNSGKSLTHEETSEGKEINLFTVRSTGETSTATEVSVKPVPVTGLTLVQPEEPITVGETLQLTAVFEPANATNKTLAWSSSDTAVATVSSTGVVTGIGEGTAMITAVTEDGAYSASCTVTVEPLPPLPTYIIMIGEYALSTTKSDDELVNFGSSNSQRYLYHGLSGVLYTPGDEAPEEILWHIIESGNGYYIQSLDGRYLNSTYTSNSYNGKTGELLLNETKDIWTLQGSLESWMVDGSTLTSTNSTKSLTHEEVSQDVPINLFTIRTTGETSVLADPEAAVYHTVTFDANGRGTAPEAQTVAHNETASEPQAPAAEGYEFTGWYVDEVCTVLYDFTAPVREDMTLYAGWSAIEYTITFLDEDGTTVLETKTAAYGTVPEYTGPEPVKTADEEYRYVFTGWSPALTAAYADAEYTAQYDTLPRSYAGPVWTWTSDDESGYTVTAEFTTDDGEEPFSSVLEAQVSTDITEAACEADGQILYSALVTFKDTDYTDSRTSVLPALGHDWTAPEYSWSEDLSTVSAERSCQRDVTHTETETVSTVRTVTKEATHTEAGEAVYTAVFTNEAFAEQTKTEILPALDTTYTLTYDANGGTGAPIPQTVTNNTGSAEFELSETVPERAGFAFKGWGTSADAEEVISDTVYVLAYPEESATLYAVWEANAWPEFTVHSLILSGEIGVNFFMDLPEIDGVDYTDSYMEFTVSGKGGKTVTDPFDPSYMNQGGKYYGFTCYVNSVQMADTITAVFHYGDDLTVSQEYSVQDYLKTFEANQASFDEKTRALIRSIADYGHFAQLFMSETNEWTIGTDYAELTTYYTESFDLEEANAGLAAYAVSQDIENSGISAVTQRLWLDSSTTLDVFFKVKKGVEFSGTAVFNGKTYEAEETANGRYCFHIEGISAHMLGTNVVITGDAGGEYEVQVSVLSYAYKLINSTLGDNAKQCAAALYQYYNAAVNYRK